MYEVFFFSRFLLEAVEQTVVTFFKVEQAETYFLSKCMSHESIFDLVRFSE